MQDVRLTQSTKVGELASALVKTALGVDQPDPVVVDTLPAESKATHQPDTGQLGLPRSGGAATDAAQDPV
jgi:hypothetical protein